MATARKKSTKTSTRTSSKTWVDRAHVAVSRDVDVFFKSLKASEKSLVHKVSSIKNLSKNYESQAQKQVNAIRDQAEQAVKKLKDQLSEVLHKERQRRARKG